MHKNSRFVQMKLTNTCFKTFIKFIQGFLFYVTQFTRLDKFLAMLHLSKHFHQKIRQHAIVIAVTTLHRLIYRTFSS